MGGGRAQVSGDFLRKARLSGKSDHEVSITVSLLFLCSFLSLTCWSTEMVLMPSS
jgi:hypothetical protein